MSYCYPGYRPDYSTLFVINSYFAYSGCRNVGYCSVRNGFGYRNHNFDFDSRAGHCMAYTGHRIIIVAFIRSPGNSRRLAFGLDGEWRGPASCRYSRNYHQQHQNGFVALP